MSNLPIGLWEIKKNVEEIARGFGLDFFETIFEVVDYKTMNAIAAFGGFPTRYNHWRFGMEYEQLSKSYEYGLSKIYEMVINTDPAYAYLLEGNSYTEQKLVMAHVYGHVDFFKNNYFFSKTNRRMVDVMANHATRVRRYIDRYGLDKVEDFIETCLSIDNLIDYHSPFIARRRDRDEDEEPVELNEMGIPKLHTTKDYMEDYINPSEFIESQKQKMEDERERRKRFPEYPEKDILHFLVHNAPLERWEADILSMIREEAYYFAPQAQTKVMNEGWACVDISTRIFTDSGVLRFGSIGEIEKSRVSDGTHVQEVYDSHIIRDRPTLTIRTRRGLLLTGSRNHRIMDPDGNWRQLDELSQGDVVKVSGGDNLWALGDVKLDWSNPVRVTWSTIEAWNKGLRNVPDAIAEPIRQAAKQVYTSEENLAVSTQANRRKKIQVPERVDEALGAFLGYMVGDGHISDAKRNLGLTTADKEQAEHFQELAATLFGVETVLKLDNSGGNSRWRALVHSFNLAAFLKEACGLLSGPSASEKTIPDVIMRSPEPVVAAFLRAYFDCDGYAGKQGVILSTASEEMSKEVQLLLLNFGILNRRRQQSDGCYHVHVAGASAKRFSERIGFGLSRKQKALKAYVEKRKGFKKESWTDEIVSIEHGRGDVYDISVRETHRYAAGGFINHNSYWHSRIMTEKAATAAEIIDYADSNAGVMATSPGNLNPYKLGVELWRNIQKRWDRGQYGKEWEECEDLEKRVNWNRNLGKGMDKIFQVRRLYNDVTFIDEFLTEEFCREQKMLTFAYNHKADQYEIASREFREIKEKILFSLTNFGQPFIYVTDGNFQNRSELLLHHKWDGTELRLDYARDVLRNLFRIWKRPVNILTIVEDKGRVLTYDGTQHREHNADYQPI